MQVETRRELVTRIRGYLENETTAMTDAVFTNPVASYTCPERHALERRSLFRDYPLLLGLSAQLPSPGDYLTDSFAGLPLLLVRQPDGALRGFINACSHRGAPVIEGAGSNRTNFVCPYHAWSYGLDGQLLRIPGEAGFAEINRDEYGLKPIAVIEEYGLIWAVPNPSLSGAPIDIDRHLGGLAPEFASYGFEGYHHFATRVLEPRINWKMGIDGFLESYHLRVLHPKTVGPLYFTNRSTADAFDLNHRMIAIRKTFAAVRDDGELASDFLRHTIELYTLFPNTMLVYQMDHLEIWRLYPDAQDPNRCKMVLSLYTPQPVTSDSAQRHWENNFKLALATVEEEDLALGESIQRGYDSGAQSFVTYGRNEPALAHFHGSLERALGVQR